MSDRENIYELLEQAHEISYPNYTVGAFLKALSYDIGSFDKLDDDEFVRRLSGYISHPFHEPRKERTDL